MKAELEGERPREPCVPVGTTILGCTPCPRMGKTVRFRYGNTVPRRPCLPRVRRIHEREELTAKSAKNAKIDGSRGNPRSIGKDELEGERPRAPIRSNRNFLCGH